MKCAYKDLVPKHQFRGFKKPEPDLPCRGFDTETRRKDDRVFVLGCGDGDFLGDKGDQGVLKVSNGWLPWLFEKGLNYSGSWWNIDFDMKVLFKSLGDIISRQLDNGEKVKLLFGGESYSLHYIKGKSFKIRKGNKYSFHWDACQFYDKQALGLVAKAILGKDKVDIDPTKFTDEFIEKEFESIRIYCLQDCILTQELAEKKQKFIRDQLDVHKRAPKSVANIAEADLLKGYIPRLYYSHNKKVQSTIPEEVIKYAVKSYLGNPVDLYSKGFYPSAYKTDRISAYPAELAKMPDFTKGEWFKSSTYIPGMSWGIVRCRVFMHPDYPKHLVGWRRDNRFDGTVLYPIGLFPGEQYKLLNEFEFINSLPGCYCDLLDCWYYEEHSLYRPYAPFVKLRFKQKKELSEMLDDKGLNPSEYLEISQKLQVVKTVLNSVYGKTVETILNWTDGQIEYNPGNLFMPMVGAYVTGNHRLYFMKLYLKNYNKGILACNTDDMFTILPLDCDYGLGLGQMKLKPEESNINYLALNCGIASFGDFSSPDKILSTYRGYTNFKAKNWVDLIRKDPNSKVIPMIQNRVLGIAECTNPNSKYSAIDIGRFIIFTKIVDVNYSRKRVFEHIPKVGALLNRNFRSDPIVC